GQGEVLEGLLGKAVAGLGGGDDPVLARLLELGRRGQDLVEAVRGLEAGLLEQVLAVVLELGPAVARDRDRLAVGPDQAEGPLREGVAAQALEHVVGGAPGGRVRGRAVLSTGTET